MKIPRINQGDRPSAVVGLGRLDNSMAGVAGALGDVADTALGIATNAELAERKRLAEAMAAKQKIVDTLDAGARTGDFEESARSLSDSLKQQYADNPTEAIEVFRKEAETLATDQVSSATNDNVRLDLAQATQSRILSMTRELHDWVSAKQTQNAKGNMVKMLNTTANNAASYGSAAALERGIATAGQQLRPLLEMAYGDKAGDEEQKLYGNMAKRYADAAAQNSPLQLAAELESSSTLKANLSPDDHAALVKAAEKGYMGLKDRRDYNLAKAAFEDNDALAGLVGSPDFVNAAAAKETALVEQRKTLAVDPSLKPADRKTQTEAIDAQLERITALKSIAYKQADLTATDDPKVLQDLWQYQDEMFGKKAKKSAKENLTLLLAQQDRLIKARDSKQISYGMFKTMFDDTALAYKAASAEEESNTGFLWWVDAREAGNRVLNSAFKADFKGQSAEKKARVRIEYIKRLNAAGNVTNEQAEKIALRSLSLETGVAIDGIK